MALACAPPPPGPEPRTAEKPPPRCPSSFSAMPGAFGAKGSGLEPMPMTPLLTLEKALEKDPVERLAIDGGAVRLGGAGGGPLAAAWEKESASGSGGALRALAGSGGRLSW